MNPTPTRGRSAATPKSRRFRPSSAGLLISSVFVVLVVAVLVVIVVSDGGDDDPTPPRETRDVVVDGDPLPPVPESGADPAVGMSAPEVTGRNFSGSPVTVPVPGRPTIVVFAAHWCPHCQREVPLIRDWIRDGGATGSDVVLVATGTNPDAPSYPPSSWLDEVGWSAPVLVDDADGTAAIAYGLAGYPLMVAVDRTGAVTGRLSGEQPVSALDEMAAGIT